MAEKRFLLRWSGWFLFMNFFLFVMLVSRYLKYAGTIEGSLPLFYLPLAITGHVASLLFIGFLLLFLPVIWGVPQKKWVYPIGVILTTIAITGLCIDYGVYSQYRFHLNRMVITLMFGAGSEVFDFSMKTYIYGVSVIFGILVFESLLVFLADRAARIVVGRPWVKWGSIALGIFAFLGSNLIHVWANAAYYRPVVAITRHIPLYNPLTARRLMEKSGLVDLEHNREISRLMGSSPPHAISYPASPLTFDTHNHLKNILFIVVDSMRYDMMSTEVMPCTRRFLDQYPSIIFDHHTSGGNGTRTGIFTLFYGLLGSYWTVMESEQIGPVFIHTLLDKKYQMGVFASAKLTAPAFNQTVFREVDHLRTYSDGKTAWERDTDSVRDWDAWFDQRERAAPFFSFLFFDSAHAYEPPPDYPRPFQPVQDGVDFHQLNESYDPVPFINLYKTALHFVDSQIGIVLEKLKATGALENTLILITSDHGQEFNDNRKNFWGHGSNFTRYQIQVPLAIYWPGKERAVISHRTNHVDIVPTILTGLFSCKNPPKDYSNGRDLFDSSPRKWVFAGGTTTDGIVEADRITETDELGDYEIYDLENTIIPEGVLRGDIVRAVMNERSAFFRRESSGESVSP